MSQQRFKAGDKVTPRTLKTDRGFTSSHIAMGRVYTVENISSPTSKYFWVDIEGRKNCTSDGSYEEDLFDLVNPVLEYDPKQQGDRDDDI
jgi:hypothetical protein